LTRIDLNKDIIFDIDEIIDMEWETGTYILYTFARICSILRQWEQNINSKDNANFDLLNHELEFQLIKKIDESYQTILNTKDELKPHLISRYLLDMCKLFNLYYNKVNILKSENNIRNIRLLMLLKVKKILKLHMNLLWMMEVEKM
jgi:arginyl-tRNA synthetase